MEDTERIIRDYLSALGKKGGSAKSERKTAAVRRNARLGGWPKGRPRGPKRVKEVEQNPTAAQTLEDLLS